ncbi:SH3 domain-containing protein [Pelagibacterium luteolum]|nr:SH3 domain-containing protein [Pelagibacterium luteolum]
MSLSSRLAVPAVIGGLVAIMISGVFSPPAMARGEWADTIARVNGLEQTDQLNVWGSPTAKAEKIGQLNPKTWVWIDRCVAGDDDSDWCLVERSQTKGWVDARYLTIEVL